jgi:hypothetical protein
MSTGDLLLLLLLLLFKAQEQASIKDANTKAIREEERSKS